MIEFLVYLTILSGILGQLLKLPFGSGNLYPLDLLTIVTVTSWVLGKLLDKDYRFKIPHYLLFLSFFLFWTLITLVRGKMGVAPQEFLTGAFYFIRFVFYSLFSLVVYDLKIKSDVKNPKEDTFTPRIHKVLIASSVLLAIFGVIQLAVYPDLSKLASQYGYDPHKNRLVSTFLDPNFTAAYLVLGSILILSQNNSTSSTATPLLRSSRVTLGLLGLLFIALIFTFSRSGWLMLAASIFLYGLLRSPKLLIVALIAGFLAYFAVPRVQTRISGITDPDDSAKLRLVSWGHAVTIFEENLIFGVGFNLYRPAQERFGFFDYKDMEGGHAGAGSDSSLLF